VKWSERRSAQGSSALLRTIEAPVANARIPAASPGERVPFDGSRHLPGAAEDCQSQLGFELGTSGKSTG